MLMPQSTALVPALRVDERSELAVRKIGTSLVASLASLEVEPARPSVISYPLYHIQINELTEAILVKYSIEFMSCAA